MPIYDPLPEDTLRDIVLFKCDPDLPICHWYIKDRNGHKLLDGIGSEINYNEEEH
jgi:hypothetical protein